MLGLREHEHRVLHFSRSNHIEAHAPFLEILERAGIACADVPYQSLRDEKRRREALGDFEPEVVLFHWWGHDPWREWLQELNRAPLSRRPCFVCVLHNSNFPALPGYDRYVPVARSQLKQVEHIAPDRVRVIPNGVDRDRFRAERVRERFDGELVIGRVSSLREGKIPVDWVRTAARFEVPRARFIIAGGGNLLPVLDADVRERNLEQTFSLTGFVPRPDVSAMLARFDVFCHVTSTANECNPLALIEALAAGLPIVAEARGGIPEIVSHGVNGLLAGSVDEVGEHLNELQRRPELVARLSEGARRTSRHFSLRRQLDRYRALLADVERERYTGFRAKTPGLD